MTTVDEYIAQIPAPVRAQAKQLRQTILKAAPKVEEKLSYGMPYYSYKGRLIYWGAFKDHLGLYIMDAARQAMADKIKPYRKSKATLHFALGKPLPVELITEIVKTQYQANDQK